MRLLLMLSLQSHFESKSSCCYHMYLYIACVPSKLSFGPHICVKATCPCIHCVAIACTHVSNSWASQALFLVSESTSHSSRDNHPSLCPRPMSLCPWVASHPSSMAMAACFSKGNYHPLLMSKAHASSCCCYGTVPRSFLLLVQPQVMAIAHESFPMHEALRPHVSHPTSCFELALLLLHLHAKQQAMAL